MTPASRNRSPRVGREGVDPDAWAALVDGLSPTQIGQLFHVGRDAVHRRLRGIKPTGRRGGAEIYKLVDLIPAFYKPSEAEIIEIVSHQRPADFPPRLQAAFWRGQQAKQDYLERTGHLWPTAQIVELVGGMVKELGNTLRLTLDRVERRTELSDVQRQIVDDEIRTAQFALAAKVQAMEGMIPKAADPGGARGSDDATELESDEI